MPAAQRVLVPDVPAQAVVALLQYLYTAHPIIPSWLRLHVLELASRYGCSNHSNSCFLFQVVSAMDNKCLVSFFFLCFFKDLT